MESSFTVNGAAHVVKRELVVKYAECRHWVELGRGPHAGHPVCDSVLSTRDMLDAELETLHPDSPSDNDC